MEELTLLQETGKGGDPVVEGSPGAQEARERESHVVPALRECDLGIVRMTNWPDLPRTERFPGTQDLQC